MAIQKAPPPSPPDCATDLGSAAGRQHWHGLWHRHDKPGVDGHLFRVAAAWSQGGKARASALLRTHAANWGHGRRGEPAASALGGPGRRRTRKQGHDGVAHLEARLGRVANLLDHASSLEAEDV